MLKRSIDHFHDWISEWNEARTRQLLYVILAVLFGLFIGLLVDTILNRVGNFVFPPPPILDIADKEQLRALYNTMPVEAHLIRVLSWAIGTMVGGYAAVRMGKMGQFPAWIVGILLLASYLIGMLGLPNPLWLVLLCPILVSVCSWAGGWLGMYVNMRRDMTTQGA